MISSLRPEHPSKTHLFCILEQGEYEGQKGFWVEDEEGLEGFTATNDEETFWVLEENDAFIARKVSGRNQIQEEKRKRNIRKQKGQPPTRWLQTLSKKWLRREGQYGQRKSGSLRPGILDKKKLERKGRKENRSSSIPMMETKVIHPMTVAKEKADMKRKIQNVPRQRIWRSSPPISRMHHPQILLLHMPVGQTRIGNHHGIGVNQAVTHPIRHLTQVP